MKHICKICGYQYDEDRKGPLPADFICPLCGADLSVFTSVETKTKENP